MLMAMAMATCSFDEHIPRVAYSLEPHGRARLHDDENAAGVRPQRAYDGVTRRRALNLAQDIAGNHNVVREHWGGWGYRG
jgi:hypothetical protein